MQAAEQRNSYRTKRVEMHLHTKEGSGCAHVPAYDAVKVYAQAGYSSIVVTNHFNRICVPKPGLSQREAVEYYVDIYRRMEEYGGQLGIDVWFGIEVCLAGGIEDFLVYGAEPDFLFDNLYMYDMTQQELFKECEQYGCLLYQAHPCRNGYRTREEEYLHGVEVYNGNPRSVENNVDALLWAKQHGLRRTSGSDFHQMEDLGRGGLIVPEHIRSMKELTAHMREQEVTLIVT